MPITLDPAKQFVQIRLLYVEEETKYGNMNYVFINNKEDMDKWKSKGYKYEDEVKELMKPKTDKTPLPGVPIKEQANFDSTKVIYSINTKWKRMSWKDQNVIFSKCLRTSQNADGTPHTELDTITYRDMKLKQCLKEWDIRNAHGDIVPVNNEAIDSLSPDIANEFINAFERYTEASSEDLGE